MLNIVYVGRVKLQQEDILEGTKAAAKAFLNLTVQLEQTATTASSSPVPGITKGSRGVSHKPTRSISTSRRHLSLSKSRPLLIKAPSNTHAPPVLVVLAPQQQQRISGPHMKSEVLLKGASSDENTIDFSSLNSYQKAKLRCADKFKCDLCGKGFPLGCLLQRHKRTHLDSKPHSCNYCDKGFSSKTTLKHHLFMQHLEEKSKKDGLGKRLLEGSVGAVGVASRGVKQPVEIIGVEDITRQIAVQMEGGG